MSDEGAALLAELREFRDENDHLLNAIRADVAVLRDELDEGFREVDRRFAEMRAKSAVVSGRLQEIAAMTSVIIQQLGDDSAFPTRRTLG